MWCFYLNKNAFFRKRKRKRMATDAAIAEALIRFKGDEVAAAGWFKDLFKSREQKETERAERAAAEEEFREKERRSSLGPRGRLIEDAEKILRSKEYPGLVRARMLLRRSVLASDQALQEEDRARYDAVADFLNGTRWTRHNVPEGFQADDWGAIKALSEYKYADALATWAVRDILVRRGQPLVKSANKQG
jgi:hypothetical protein